MGIPVTLETQNEGLKRIFNVPLVGALLIILVAFGPVAVPVGVAGRLLLPEANEDLILAGGFFLSIPWAFWLEKAQGVKIRLLFIPAWVMAGLLAVVGLSKAFGVID